MYDAVIAGGGPAGLSAALWCSELGLSSILIDEGMSLGGQLHLIHNAIANYPGAYFANGAECIEAFHKSLENCRFDLMSNSSIAAIDAESAEVAIVGGQRLRGRAMILATGVRRRQLNVMGEAQFQGKGILTSGAAQRELVMGKRVAVVGGGDAALENALLLGEVAERTYLIHRRSDFSARREFIDRIAAEPKIRPLINSVVRSINGDTQLRSITIGLEGDRLRDIEVDHLIIRIGVDPNSELVRNQLAADKRGYLLIDATCRTSSPICFAIGDVASPVSPTIATAVGMGSTAAKAVHQLVRQIK